MSNATAPSPEFQRGSVWTTPAGPATAPLPAAAIDRTVSRESLQMIAREALRRSETSTGNVTDELLRQSF